MTNRIKKTLCSALLLLSLLTASAQERVLFVGNSLTFSNDMPTLFEQIATEKGHRVEVRSHTVGGAGLAQLLPSEEVARLVRDGRWDKVVLQPGTSESVGQSLSTAATARVISQFVETLRATSPDAKVYLYEIGYGIPPGTGNGDYNYYLMAQGIILDSVRNIARLVGVPFAPAGECFREHYATHHDLMLHPVFNDIHPNLAGSYLVACAIFETLYEEPVAPCRFHSTLEASQAEYLQGIADRVVLPRREEWGLGPGSGGEEPPADTVGIQPPTSDLQFTIYPNPTTGRVRVDTDSTVILTDPQGRRHRLQPQDGMLDLGAFAPGVYIIQTATRSRKLVIARP